MLWYNTSEMYEYSFWQASVFVISYRLINIGTENRSSAVVHHAMITEVHLTLFSSLRMIVLFPILTSEILWRIAVLNNDRYMKLFHKQKYQANPC